MRTALLEVMSIMSMAVRSVTATSCNLLDAEGQKLYCIVLVAGFAGTTNDFNAVMGLYKLSEDGLAKLSKRTY